MRPIKFKGSNVNIGEDQPQYGTLPVRASKEEHGEMISCWKLSFIERVIVLFTGKIWRSELTFHTPVHPSILTTKRSHLFTLS